MQFLQGATFAAAGHNRHRRLGATAPFTGAANLSDEADPTLVNRWRQAHVRRRKNRERRKPCSCPELFC